MKNPGYTVIYDLKSVPESMDLDKLNFILKKTKILFWDSYNKGEEPKIVILDPLIKELNIEIKDIRE